MAKVRFVVLHFLLFFYSQWLYKNGSLHCDGLPLEILRQELIKEWGHLASPVFIYSATTLSDNVHQYTNALAILVCPLCLSGYTMRPVLSLYADRWSLRECT